MFTIEFWMGAAERGMKTGAQFALLTLGVGVTAGTAEGEAAQAINAFAVDFVTFGGAFLGGVLVSVLTSLVLPGKVTDTFYAGKHVSDE